MSHYEYFYPGTPSVLESEYQSIFTGYTKQPLAAGRLSLTTNIGTGNQLQEVSTLLNQGVKNVEVSVIDKQIFDQIPKQHMKEIARLAALTNSHVSLHAPFRDMNDLSGFSREGWSEENREFVEREIIDVLERGNEIGGKEGNVNITIHPSNQLPGTSYSVNDQGERVTNRMIGFNTSDGRFMNIEAEEEYKPEQGGNLVRIDPQKRINEINEKFWNDQVRELGLQARKADEYLIEGRPVTATGELLEKGSKAYQIAENQVKHGQLYLDGIDSNLRDLYSRAMKSANETDNKKAKEILKEAHNEYSRKVSEMNVASDDYYRNVVLKRDAVNIMLKKLGDLAKDKDAVPKVIIPADEFAMKQTSKTLSNAAFAAYDKFQERAPTLSIENPPYGLAISSGEDIATLVEKSRAEFAEKLVDKKHISSSKAEKIAEKMIGVTWDTAHISAMRKHGFSQDEVVRQSKKVAPYIKHVHMNDALSGQAMGDLPPGMGDVPIGEIMGEFEKKGFTGTAVFESGAFAAMHRISPHPFVLEAIGSPLYAMKAGPSWNNVSQSGNESAYYSGMGAILPDTNFQMYGTGFTNLTPELGGQAAGRGGASRFSGTPMA